MPAAFPNVHAWAAELETAIIAAQAAAATIMDIYIAQSAQTYTKQDGSPVTDADLAADTLITQMVQEHFPQDGMLTEESPRTIEPGSDGRVWVVDPIDGTKQYVARTGRFDVLIALVENHRPVVAATIQPTTGLIHAAVVGQGAWRNDGAGWERFTLGDAPTPPRLASSRWYCGVELADEIARIAQQFGSPVPEPMEVGFQPRAFDPTQRTYDVFLGFRQAPGRSFANEWDIAASDLIINEAGGRFTDVFGRLQPYNKKDTHISGGILVSTDPALHDRVIRAIAPLYPSDDADDARA